jgi:hypothetical protein
MPVPLIMQNIGAVCWGEYEFGDPDRPVFSQIYAERSSDACILACLSATGRLDDWQ